MNTKIIAIFAIFVLAIVCASAVQAVEAAQNVKIDDVDFQIPDGFEHNPEVNIMGERDKSGKAFNSVQAYKKGDDVIYICVADYIGGNKVTLDDFAQMGGESKTINGVKGYAFKGCPSDVDWVLPNDGNKTFYGFRYPTRYGGEAVMILTTDESLLDTIVVKSVYDY